MKRCASAAVLSMACSGPAVLRTQMEALNAWLDAEESKQAGLAPHADPSLLSGTVEARLADARKLFSRLNGRKKPKPGAPAPSADNGTAGEAPAASGELDADLEPSLVGDAGLEQGSQEQPGRDEL